MPSSSPSKLRKPVLVSPFTTYSPDSLFSKHRSSFLTNSLAGTESYRNISRYSSLRSAAGCIPRVQIPRIPLALSQNCLRKYRRLLVSYINKKRENYFLDGLCVNSTLTEIARMHSEDQANLGKGCHHVGSDGLSFSQRAKKAGYVYDVIGENNACMYAGPWLVYKWFMANSGKRSLALDAQIEEIGVHVSRSKRGVMYWTVLFGKPWRMKPKQM